MTSNNLRRLNTCSNSIPQSSVVEFVAIVGRIKWEPSPIRFILSSWIIFLVEYLEINSIMVCLACPPFVTFKPILPSNLNTIKHNSRETRMATRRITTTTTTSTVALTTLFLIARKASFTGCIARREVGGETLIAFSNSFFVG